MQPGVAARFDTIGQSVSQREKTFLPTGKWKREPANKSHGENVSQLQSMAHFTHGGSTTTPTDRTRGGRRALLSEYLLLRLHPDILFRIFLIFQ
jgi:hypothetical protein